MKCFGLLQVACLLHVVTAIYAYRSGDSGHYYTLPSLREQAKLQDEWTQSRIEAIPALLQKHGVEAWIVSHISVFNITTIFHGYLPFKMAYLT